MDNEIYYNYTDDGKTLHLSPMPTATMRTSGGGHPWTINLAGVPSKDRQALNAPNPTKVVIDGPIQLPPDSSYFFSGALCSVTNFVGLDNLDTSQVTDMAGMFADCHSVKQLDLSSWDVSNVASFIGIFDDCVSLTSVLLGPTSAVLLPLAGSCAALVCPTMADEASRAVSIEGEPSEPRPQTR